MRLLYRKINPSSERSLSIRRETVPCLDEAWHFHEECELILIVRGHGRRFVGDSISDFTEGELAFIGPNLPHLWRNDSLYQRAASEPANGQAAPVEVVIVQFREQFLGESFFRIPDMYPIKDLFERSAFGLQITGQTRSRLAKQIAALPDLRPFDQIIELLKVLYDMSVSGDRRQIASRGYTGSYDESDCVRMNGVTAYLMDHFQEEISLNDVADVVSLSPSTLSRYVKQRTGKTFSTLLNEVRLGHACKLLIRSDLSVAEIAYACGYRSLTNFNRQFRYVKRMSPSSFRREHQIVK